MPTWPTITDGVTRLSNALFGLIKTYIDDSLTGQGLPSGGATGDLLQKNSATNYDAGWTDSPTVDALTLDTAAAEATGVAKLYWDTQDVTAALGLNANITYHLGAQELVRVSNRTGTAIAAGKAVYILGAHGDRPEVALADASTEATAATTLGITAESIADSSTGYVCVSGLLRNLNTNHLTVGQLVWLSETAGELTSTRPTQPAHGVFMGLCVKQGPGTSGILYVSVVNGLELDELHDVLISGVAAGDLLKRNVGNTLWVNAAPAAFTTTDDTNVTLTLGGNASTALVNAASLTAGWTGTLAAARLNSNVVQSVVNDTNVTGSISTQALTLGWTGQLALARGGTGASTQQGALNAIAGAVTSGQYLRGDGTNVTLAAIQAGDVPTLNQNTTGSAATLTTTRTLWGQNFNGSANVTGALSDVGSVTFTGTGNRISGDFTTATIADRLAFQTSTANSNASVAVLPNGTGTAGQFLAYGNSTPTNASYIGMVQIGTTESRLQASYSGSGTYTPLVFYTGGAERLRIDTSGNVGLGVTPTLGILHAKGVITAEGPTAGADFAGYFRPSGAASAVDNSLVGLAGYGWDGSASQAGATINFRAAETWSATARGTYIQFRTVTAGSTTLSEKARIDASGNVGIGVTPSAWAATRKALQLVGGALIQGRTDTNQTVVGNNWYNDGSSFKYTANGFATNYEQSAGGHFWYTAPSGTAGNAITFTQAMTLNASGNLGVGTTSPSTRLSVAFSNATTYSATNAATWASGLIINNGATAATNVSNLINFQGASNVNAAFGVVQNASGYGDFIWASYNGSFAERMRLTSGGLLGINTTSPSLSTGAPGLEVANNAYIQLKVSSTISSAGIEFFPGSGNRWEIQANTSSQFFIYDRTAAAHRFFINSSGDVCIGTTSGIGVGAKTNIVGGGNVLHIQSTSSSANNFVSYNSSGTATASLTNGGSLSISGALSKGSGSFKIDHPLKPDTHHLVHSFIEGPQADLIYRGSVTLEGGQATVNLDDAAGMTEGTFVALCREVQCFTTNESDWDAVRGTVNGNMLTIECQNQTSAATVSWMVIGERQDMHMYETEWTDENGKVIVEPEKSTTLSPPAPPVEPEA